MKQRTITRQVRGEATSDGAGVKLTRVIGGRALAELDPFLLLDEFGSDDPNAYIAGFPDHPHRGFETVTYMLAGRMRHRDNKGNEGVLASGGVQWMTAGRGIVHSEMPEQSEGLMRGFQLWVNLPGRLKMSAPRYQELGDAGFPVVTRPGAKIKIIAGAFDGTRAPIDGIAIDPLYLDIRLDAGAALEVPVPAGHAAFVYPFDGDLQIAGATLPRRTLAVLGDGDGVSLAAKVPAAAILVAGRPIGEPVARYGPFVMNTDDEIRQAFRDYQAGQL